MTAIASVSDLAQRIEGINLDGVRKQFRKSQGWSPTRARAVEREYRDFLLAAATSPERIEPTGSVDEFWHLHFLDTKQYAADCQCIFGRILNHKPGDGKGWCNGMWAKSIPGLADFDQTPWEALRPESQSELRERISALDLECVVQLVQERDGWTQAEAVAVERDYRDYLLSVATSTNPVEPSPAVDAFWHRHIAFSSRYAADCEAIFGRYLHHRHWRGRILSIDA